MSEAAQARVWDLPSVSGRSVQGRRAGPTVGELEAIEQKAYQEAHAAGYEAGMKTARAETQSRLAQLTAQVERMAAVLDQLAGPLAHMDEEVGQQLAGLSLVIAKQLVRRELKADPAQVIAIIRETVGLLPAAARDVRVHLHPEDAAVVRERLAAPGAEPAWSIVEDPVLSRGGCRVMTDTTRIDARLETRINSVASSLLGEERTAARAEAPAP